MVDLDDTGIYPLISSAFVMNLKSAKLTVIKATKLDSPIGRRHDNKILLWFYYSGIECKFLDTKISTGKKNSLISLYNYPYSPFCVIIHVVQRNLGIIITIGKFI